MTVSLTEDNPIRVELYVNDSLVLTVQRAPDKKKPVVIWDVDTTYLGQRITYRLRALDLDSNTAVSPTIPNVLVDKSPTPPPAPTNLQIWKFGAGQVNLSWEDMSQNEDGFEVWKRISTGPWTLLQSLPANAISTNDSGIVGGTAYRYKVRAVNAFGYSDSKEAAIGVDVVYMNAPTQLRGTPLGTRMVQLEWTDNSNAELGFVIERRVTSGSGYSRVGMVGPDQTSFVDTAGLAPSSSYTYRVAARGQFIQSDWSNEETVMTLYLDTSPPTDLNAVREVGAGRVKLTWRSNTIYDANTRIERRPDPGGTFVEIGKVGTGATTFTDTTAQAVVAYSYRVRILSVDGHFTIYSNIVGIPPERSPGKTAGTGRAWGGGAAVSRRFP